MNRSRIGKMAVVAVAMALVLSCAMPVVMADRAQPMRCPSSENPASDGAVNSTPRSTSVEYTQNIQGVGYESIHGETSTGREGYSGIGTSIYSRGTGSVSSSRTIVVDTKGKSFLNQKYDYSYYPVGSSNVLLKGETGIQSYATGVVVRDRYSQTYGRTAEQAFTGDNTQTEYSSTAQTYGQTNFRARIVDTENYHHTVMRVSEKHVGDFTTNRTIRVELTPASSVPASAVSEVPAGRNVCYRRP